MGFFDKLFGKNEQNKEAEALAAKKAHEQLIQIALDNNSFPDKMAYWKKSFEHYKRDKRADLPIGLTAEQFICFYHFDDPNENCAKLEVQLSINTNKQFIDCASSYEIDIAEFEEWVNSKDKGRILPYKLAANWDTIKQLLTQEGNEDLKEELYPLLHITELGQIAMTDFRGINYK